MKIKRSFDRTLKARSSAWYLETNWAMEAPWT